MNKVTNRHKRDRSGEPSPLILALTFAATVVIGTAAAAITSVIGNTDKAAKADGADEAPAAAIADERSSDWLKEVKLYTKEDPRRIEFIRRSNSAPPTETTRKTISEINALARTIRRVFEGKIESRKRLFRNLHATASILEKKEPDYDEILENIEEIKAEIVDEFPVVRDKISSWNFFYLVPTGIFALGGIALIFLSKTGELGLPMPNEAGVYNPIVSTISAGLIIPLGVAFGQYLEYLFSVDKDLNLSDIVKINPGRWRPHQRLRNNILTSYVFAWILGIEMIKVGVNSLLLNDFFTKQPILSLAVGFVSGFAFPIVRDLVGKIKPAEQK